MSGEIPQPLPDQEKSTVEAKKQVIEQAVNYFNKDNRDFWNEKLNKLTDENDKSSLSEASKQKIRDAVVIARSFINGLQETGAKTNEAKRASVVAEIREKFLSQKGGVEKNDVFEQDFSWQKVRVYRLIRGMKGEAMDTGVMKRLGQAENLIGNIQRTENSAEKQTQLIALKNILDGKSVGGTIDEVGQKIVDYVKKGEKVYSEVKIGYVNYRLERNFLMNKVAAAVNLLRQDPGADRGVLTSACAELGNFMLQDQRIQDVLQKEGFVSSKYLYLDEDEKPKTFQVHFDANLKTLTINDDDSAGTALAQYDVEQKKMISVVRPKKEDRYGLA